MRSRFRARGVHGECVEGARKVHGWWMWCAWIVHGVRIGGLVGAEGMGVCMSAQPQGRTGGGRGTGMVVHSGGEAAGRWCMCICICTCETLCERQRRSASGMSFICVVIGLHVG